MNTPATERATELGAPIAFTSADVLRGVLRAWMSFMILLELLLLVLTVLTALSAAPSSGSSAGFAAGAVAHAIGSALIVAGFYLVVAAVVGGAVSGVVALLMLPVAGWLAARLARVRALWKHLATYGLLGFSTGAVVGGGLAALLFSGAPDVVLIIGSAAALLTGVSGTVGWWLAARPVRRAEGVATH